MNICAVCGNEFEHENKQRKYCSPDCQKKMHNQRMKAYREKHKIEIQQWQKNYQKKLYGELNKEDLKRLKPKVNYWIDAYKKAEARKDVGTQIAMIAKAYSDMPGKQYISYGNLMAIKENDPVRFFRICSEVMAYKDSEEKNHE